MSRAILQPRGKMTSARDASNWTPDGKYAVRLRGWTVAKYGVGGTTRFILWEGEGERATPIGVFETAQAARDQAAEVERTRNAPSKEEAETAARALAGIRAQLQTA
jgi:hypothetical protein